MGDNQTLAEQIISAHTEKSVKAGEIVIVDVDGTMSHDAGAPYSIRAFEAMGGKKLWNPGRTAFVIDHAAPAPTSEISQLHLMIREFASKTGSRLFDAGEGICHQLMVENHLVKPGDLFLGGDSHTPTYGALGAFAIGVGATDIAGAWLTGKTWLRVPRSQLVILEGCLMPGVFPKDIILNLVCKIGMSGAIYEALEFSGAGLDNLSLSGKMTLANMAAETGAKSAIMMPETDHGPLFKFLPEKFYSAVHRVDLSELSPQVSLPNAPDKVTAVERVAGTKIHISFIGTCTNGRTEDLRAAAAVLKGQKIPKGTQLIIAPASRSILTEAIADGTAEIFLSAGATILPPGCGPCSGTHMGVPADGQTIISSANRNFPGRMGNPKADIYLASPAMVAASALAGEITDPRPFFKS